VRSRIDVLSQRQCAGHDLLPHLRRRWVRAELLETVVEVRYSWKQPRVAGLIEKSFNIRQRLLSHVATGLRRCLAPEPSFDDLVAYCLGTDNLNARSHPDGVSDAGRLLHQ